MNAAVVAAPDQSVVAEAGTANVPLPEYLKQAETAYLAKVLERAGGNRRAAAKLAGISYASFCRKVALLRLRVRVTVEH